MKKLWHCIQLMKHFTQTNDPQWRWSIERKKIIIIIMIF